MTAKDKIFENGEIEEFEFKKTLYTVQPVFDSLHLSEPMGYMVTVESNSEKLLESIMQNRLSMGKKLRINFNDNDDLEVRISESLKFLNQIYGVSKNMVEKILKNNIDDNNAVVDEMVSNFIPPDF